MDEKNRFPDAQFSSEDPVLQMYDIVTCGVRLHPEWQETPPETQAVLKALEDAGWEKTENSDKDPYDSYSSYAKEFYDDDTCFVCEAWVSVKKSHLHQVGGYGVIGVVIGSVPDKTFPPFILDDLLQMEMIIEQAVKSLVSIGIPFLEENSFLGITDLTGEIAAQNEINRKKFGLDEAEKRDLA